MKTRIISSALAALGVGALYGHPTRAPKASKVKPTASARERAAQPSGATGVFVALLHPDGTVEKVIVAKSTGNEVLDKVAVRGLSFMRFPPETLTKAERAKGQKVFPLTISAEELKKFRYGPKPQW